VLIIARIDPFFHFGAIRQRRQKRFPVNTLDEIRWHNAKWKRGANSAETQQHGSFNNRAVGSNPFKSVVAPLDLAKSEHLIFAHGFRTSKLSMSGHVHRLQVDVRKTVVFLTSDIANRLPSGSRKLLAGPAQIVSGVAP
jgi:hypothetical protein